MNLHLSESKYDVILEKDIMVRMRDGTYLATDIYRPAIGGTVIDDKLPSILQSTPYNKEDPIRIKQLGKWFSRRGYNVIIQDFRGRFKSEGIFYKYSNMGEDGYDTIEWITKQKWSNKKIGTIGTSFMAHFQIALACMNPPHLSTMIVNQGGFSNAFLSSCRHMGAFELRQMTWAFSAAKNSREANANPRIKAALEEIDPANYLDPELGNLKEGQSPLRLVPSYEKFYFDMLTKAVYDDYWKKIGLCAQKYYDEIPDIPILLLGGWYDSYTRAISDIYIGLSTRKNGPIRLIFGPWVHGWETLNLTYSGEVEFGRKASIDGSGLAMSPNYLALRWFDYFLKDTDTSIDTIPPVKLFVMGGGTGQKSIDGKLHHGGVWRNEHEWPLSRTHFTKYYLQKGGDLSLSLPKKGIPPSTYTFDPRKPVPTLGGNISAAMGTMMPGAYDQVERPNFLGCKPPYMPLSSRNDVLVFQTSELTKNIEVTGPIEAKLWISSSARDTDFTLKLIDQYPSNDDYPNGFAMNLSDTIFRARFHNSWSEPELLESNKIYRLDMVSYPTSNLFKVGHRIRVDISSSNYPRFDINPNSGESLGRGRKLRIAHQGVYHDAEHPSHIILPIIPSAVG